jgi:hypothetical protein
MVLLCTFRIINIDDQTLDHLACVAMCSPTAAGTEQLWYVKSKTRRGHRKMCFHEARAPLCKHENSKSVLMRLSLVNGVWFLNILERPSLPTAPTSADQ